MTRPKVSAGVQVYRHIRPWLAYVDNARVLWVARCRYCHSAQSWGRWEAAFYSAVRHIDDNASCRRAAFLAGISDL